MAGSKENVKMGSVWLGFASFTEDGRIRWLGYSEGGPTFARAPERTDINVDQLDTAIFSRVTAENMTATFPSVEITKQNILLAFPGAKLSGDRIDIYPESSVQQSNMGGIVLLHPVFAGEPIGEYLDPAALGTYDSSSDIMFMATLTSELDISFTREDMIHIPLTFNATPDPIGRLAVWNNPFSSDFAITGTALSATGAAFATGTLAAATANNPVFAIPNAKGWSLNGATLRFELDAAPVEEVTYQTFVYAKDEDGKVGFAVAKATLTP